jgi:hypothetical protein
MVHVQLSLACKPQERKLNFIYYCAFDGILIVRARVSHCCNMQLSHYNFTSVTCEKNASSFLQVLLFPPVVTLDHALQDDPYWTPRKNCLELIELSSINTFSLV